MTDLKKILEHLPELSQLKEWHELGMGIFENLSVVRDVYGVVKFTSDNLFRKKIRSFFEQLESIPREKRLAFFEKYTGSESKMVRLSEEITSALHRSESSDKASICGRLFKLYIEESISKEEFARYLMIVTPMTIGDLEIMAEFKRLKDAGSVEKDSVDPEALAILAQGGLLALIRMDEQGHHMAYFAERYPSPLSYEVTALGKRFTELSVL